MLNARASFSRELRKVIAPSAMAVAVISSSIVVASSPVGAAAPARMHVIQPRDILPAGTAAGPASTAGVTGSIGLAPRDPAALSTFAREVSRPGSATYGKYLAPGEFRGAFGPTDQTVKEVTGYLSSHGLHPSVSDNGLIVSFSGTARAAEATFQTSLQDVRLPSGRQARATTRALHLPSTFADQVTGIVGLSSVKQASSQLRRNPDAPTVPADVSVTPRARASAALSATLAPKACKAAKIAARGGGPQHLSDPQGLNDQAMAAAYGVDGLYDVHANGFGQHVAIFTLDGFVPSNIATFSNCYFGVDLSSNISIHKVDGGITPGTPISGETELDIEDVMGLAPGARIDVYQSANTGNGIVDGYNQIVQDDQAKVISTSWGECEDATGRGSAAMENTIFEQAAAQGQTVSAASGDWGSNDCSDSPSQLTVDDPASQPFVLAVGGTSIQSANRPPVETTWNDGDYGSGGGGISSLWPQPSWQNDATVSGVNNPTTLAAAKSLAIQRNADHKGSFCGAQFTGTGVMPCRQVPDVSAQASPGVGAITIYNADWGGWTTAGGTSSSAPLWAAMLADTASLPACAGSLGFVVPRLYSIASSPEARALAFNDVTRGTNNPGSNQGLFPATSGFDMVTGVGTPIMTAPDGGVGLAALLCGSLSTAIPVVDDVSDGYLDGDGALHAEVHGVGFGTVADPSIASVQVGGLRLDPQVDPTSTGFAVQSQTMLSVVIAPNLFPQLSSGTDDAAGEHTVVVTTTEGASSDTSPTTIMNYAPAGTGGNPTPAVTGVTASGGAKAGGKVVTVYGSGFTGATNVSFGGQAATSYTVLSSTRITATVPAYSGSTACAATGTNPSTDVCQVHVMVTGPGGTSAVQPIGAPAVIETPGCNCEMAPGLDEYDYFAAPVISSVEIPEDALGYAGTGGGSLMTVHGTGIGPFAMIGASFDGSTSLGSWADGYLPIDSTTALVVAPAKAQSVEPFTSGVQIATLATSDPSGPGYALSNVGTFSYAGVPVLSSISKSAGPSSGGTALTITGQGVTAVDGVDFSGQTIYIGQAAGFVTQSSVSHPSGSQISLMTPGTLAGPTDLYLCTASGCSDPKVAGVFTFYPPGTAILRKLMTTSGPAAGGNTIVVKGSNVGCALTVRFGKADVAAQPVAALTGCGSTGKFKVVVPKGKAGKSVFVQVLTLQGQDTGSGFSVKDALVKYTYTP
jgi:hypothetical protein